MNTQDKIKALVPYTSENLITTPLWEEGNYGLQLNLWFIVKSTLTIDTNIEGCDVFITKHNKPSETLELLGTTINTEAYVCYDISISSIEDNCFDIELLLDASIEILNRLDVAKKNAI